MKKAYLSKSLRCVLVSVIVVGALAFSWSLRLESPSALGAGSAKKSASVAAPAMGLTDTSAPASGGRPKNGTETVTFGNLANLAKGDVPIMPTIIVDYRDDDATRMREAGLLIGPLPLRADVQGGVATGGCSFAIECDDGNPCTVDTCNFPPGQPAGSGTCVHAPVPDRSNFSLAECTSNWGLLCGGCDDGLFCNGLETCQGGSCAIGTPPCAGPQVCSEGLKYCQPAACSTQKKCIGGTNPGANCMTNAQCPSHPGMNDGRCAYTDCDDLLHCNGDETCVGGVCVASENPCGSGALCGEKRCYFLYDLPGPIPLFCTSGNDCIVEGGTGTCTVEGPVCLEGRCCTNNISEPICERRKNADCTGLFYGGDPGRLLRGDTATSCTGIVLNGVEVTCPKYSSGVAPFGKITNKLGTVSDSRAVNATFGVPLNKLGDDYKLSNDPGAGSDIYFKLDYLRFVGGSVSPERISFEFYDKNQNFVEDIFFISTTAFGIYPVQFAPPLTIPSEGYVVMRNASSFSPNARHVWAVTDVVDVGSNDNATLWINSGPMTVASNLGVLAFELEGTKTSPPGGACCNYATGVCENAALPWVCKSAGNVYLGDATLCAVCDAGPQAGLYCRRCSDNSAQPCNNDADCIAGTCIPTNSACGSPGVCLAEPACGTGACCTNGNCAVVDATTCTNGGGTFVGFGTDCDADNGHDEGLQHCCPQPTYTGSDNCETVTIHVITVPPQGQVKVITITGDNSSASSTAAQPDSCFAPSTDPNADPGWWEGFEFVDDCALVRIDHCCTDPVHRPAYRVIYNSCPCGPSIFDAPNPYKPTEVSSARGGPYCFDDDNLWETYGLLPAGHYYYPVYSALAGHHGVYQMHISVEACPTAACCTGATCTDGINQLQCDALGGYFLAPPQKYPGVAACAGSICDTGSCCFGPNTCFDEIAEHSMTPTDCFNGEGNYFGGMTCKGGYCAQHLLTSCANNDDCAGGTTGPCVGDPQALAQPLPCPLCGFESNGTCQKFDDTLNFAVSDPQLGGNGMVTADDFIPEGSRLESLCVWGFYLDGDPNATNRDCGPSVAADHFRVRVYTNDTAGNGRMPKTLLGESMATSQRGTLRVTRVWNVLEAKTYGHTLLLSTPIGGMVPGNTYWLEVANDPTISGPDKCVWYWMPKIQTSSSYSFGGSNAGYEAGFEQPYDLAFCTDFALSPSTIGSMLSACCFCDGSCQQKTLADCDIAAGLWHIETADCGSVTCPSRPANDDCANAGVIPSPGTYFYENVCANTDGFGPIPSDYDPVHGSQIDFDVWYKYVTPTACDLRIDMCPTGQRFDSMFAVYHNPTNPTVCPPCALMSDPNSAQISMETLAGLAQDESCTGQPVGGSGYWVATEQILRQTLPGECFLLRMGSFPGARGRGTFVISCGDSWVSAPVADPSGIDKSRFISFKIPSSATAVVVETALRVKLVSLHHVAPPYTGGASIPFTLFEGQSMYVGPPTQYEESASGGTPFYASQLQCAPYYQDWSTITLLHVSGEAIVPSSTYAVTGLAASCAGHESNCTAVSTPLQIKTTRWGDVDTPYNPPSSDPQPDTSDISALVNKFKSAIGAPIKARALLAGGNARGTMGPAEISPDMSFTHISLCVDAFKGLPYPYKPGKCTGNASKACAADLDCTAQSTTGPCVMCP